jgi:hypothetical protein
MPFVVAALVVLGIATFLNLVLTLAVVRRLNARPVEGGEAATPGPSGEGFSPTAGVVIGTPVPGFIAQDLDGAPVVSGHADGTTLFAFFGADCRGCWTRLPGYLDYASSSDLPAERLIAVVVGDASLVPKEITRLRTAARVVSEPSGGPLSSAFGVRGFPTFAQVDTAGIVEDLFFALEDLPLTVGA